MTALVVAHLAQLGRGEALQALGRLPRGQLVVGDNRQAAGYRALDASGASHELLDRSRELGRRAASAAAEQEALDVAEDAVVLLAPAPDEFGDEVVCVRASEPPTLGGLVQRVLDAVAADHHQIQGLEHPVGEL